MYIGVIHFHCKVVFYFINITYLFTLLDIGFPIFCLYECVTCVLGYMCKSLDFCIQISEFEDFCICVIRRIPQKQRPFRFIAFLNLPGKFMWRCSEA